VRLAGAVAFAQIGVVGLDGQIELEALRLYDLPEAGGGAGLALRTPTLPVGQRESATEVAWDLPNLASACGALARAAGSAPTVIEVTDANGT
jgi:hypothetical protein